MTRGRDSVAEFELLAVQEDTTELELRLYVAGSSARSTRAIQNAREICDTHFAGRYRLDVIDVFQQPQRAKDDHILAIPTLIRKLPLPTRRFIGDLSNRAVVVDGLAHRPR